MVAYKNKSAGLLLLLSFLMVLGLVWLVTAVGSGFVHNDIISTDVINTSSNGLAIRADNGFFSNGTSYSYINVSGGMLLNISLLLNSTHGHYANVSFTFYYTAPEQSVAGVAGIFPYGIGTSASNTTVNVNASGNASGPHFGGNHTALNQSSFAAYISGIPEGYYNISVMAYNNLTNASAQDVGAQLAINFSRGFNVLIDNKAPPINNFYFNMSNFSNISSNRMLTFNVTANDTIFTQYVRIGFTNTNGPGNGTEFNVTSSRNLSVVFNGSVFTAEVNTALMTDGYYTVAVYANDSLKNFNGTIANLSFTLDRGGPNVTDLRLGGNYTNYANFSASTAAITGNVILNFTVLVNDSFSDYAIAVDRIVFFNISNSTGQINYTRAFLNATSNTWQLNITTNGNSTTWGNATIGVNLSDTRYFPDGLYYINVWANDSLGNNNRTQNLTFRIDRTKPTVSVSCSPSGPTAGESVTCTCTVSDDGSGKVVGTSGFSGGVLTESTTATGTGSFTSTTCTAFDYAGNSNTASGTWTVTAASSGGGGGSGGSGGGSSSGVPGTSEQKTWTSINTGETAKVEVENGAIGVTEVSFAVTSTVYGAWVKVSKEVALPASVSAFSGKTYRVLQITKGTALKDDTFTKAVIDFKVEKKWLADNGLSKERVALQRFADGKWNELPTTVGADDGTYVHYKAETPGFSYFVIGEKKSAVVAPVAPAEEASETVPSEAPVEEAPVEEVAMASKKPVKVLPVVAVLLVIAAIVVILVVLKRKK